MTYTWTDRFLWAGLALLLLLAALGWLLFGAGRWKYMAGVFAILGLLAWWQASTIRSWCSPPQFSGEFLLQEFKEPTLRDCLWLTRTG